MHGIGILASSADYGTSSISESYITLIHPSTVLKFTKGFKRMGIHGWLEGWRFLRRRTSGTVLCLFNAPILLGALFRRQKGTRYVGVLDWTESYPSRRRHYLTPFYDSLYVAAFNRLDDVHSPSAGFRAYYNTLGASIRPCLYPLPRPLPAHFRIEPSKPVRVLYIGADYRRKSGDLLLTAWKSSNPPNATLTFVCPSPPAGDISGVTFRRDIKAGTTEQVCLFEDHDVFILPTREEPFGFALLEAINSGMCTITTSVAGAAQVVLEAGGIVTTTPEDAVSETLRLVGCHGEICKRRQDCANFLPAYERSVRASIDDILNQEIAY